MKSTAQAHMKRDMASGGEWACICESCHAFRSLIGMEKALAVRPLVREIQLVEDQILDQTDEAAKAPLRMRLGRLYDDLAKVMEQS